MFWEGRLFFIGFSFGFIIKLINNFKILRLYWRFLCYLFWEWVVEIFCVFEVDRLLILGKIFGFVKK